MLVPSPKPVLRIELNRETYDPIGKSFPYGSRGEAARSVGRTRAYIDRITNQRVAHYFTEFNGKLFTFVDANSTQEKIDEHIEKIKQHLLEKSIIVIYLDSSYSPTGKTKTCKDGVEAKECTGVDDGTISAIKKQNPGRHTATDRNGDIVTFFSGETTLEEMVKRLREIRNKKESRTTNSKPVLRIELDRETYNPIEKSFPCESRAEAASSVGKTRGYIAKVVSQNVGYYFIEYHGQLFTFVDANSTQKEIDARIEKIKQHFLKKSVVVVYLDSSHYPTGEDKTFKDGLEAEKYTGVWNSRIYTIKKQSSGFYTSTDNNGNIVTFFSGKTTEEERIKRIKEIQAIKEPLR